MDSPAASRDAFAHEPLPDPAKYIRLLEVLDDNYSKTTKVRCRLTTWHIDSAPTYHAISYTWGDAESNTIILMNDLPLRVRTNCEFVLKQAYWYKRSHSYLYRKRKSPWYEQSRATWYNKSRYLWLDAICIDQANLTEKSKQVAMMGDIYKKASHVLASVGDHADDSLFFFQSLYGPTHYVVRPRHMFRYQRRFQGVALRFRLLHRHSTTHRFALALARLAVRPYFTRMWILQELQHAQKITILCGKYVLPNDDALYLFGGLLDDLKLLEPTKHSGQSTIALAHHYFIDHRFFRRHVNRGFPHPVWHGDWMYRLLEQSKTTVFMLRQNYATVKDNIFLLLKEVVSLLECADPRDKFYGIISLIDWGNVPPLKPDYTLNDIEVATKFIEAIMKLAKSQDVGEPMWKYVIITVKLLSLNMETWGLAEALEARRFSPKDCAQGPANMPPEGSKVYTLQRGWRLSAEEIEKNTSKLQDLPANPPKYSHKSADIFFLPRCARAGDWVIEVDSKPAHDLWYDIFDYQYGMWPHYLPLLIMREGTNGRCNALVGCGFYSSLRRFNSPKFIGPNRTAIDVCFDIEDAILFLWKMKHLYDIDPESKDWMLPFLETGVCRQQAPGSSSAALAPRLPASLEAEDVDFTDPNGLPEDRPSFFRYWSLRDSYFVLFDTKTRRGWLVNGEVVAVQLLRAYLSSMPLTEPFDFSRLDYIETKTREGVFRRRNDWKDRGTPIFRVLKDVGESTDHDESSKGKPLVEGRSLVGILEDFFEILVNVKPGKPFPGEAHYFFGMEITAERHRNTVVKGWDFDKIYRTNKAKVYTHVFEEKPTWHGFVKEIRAPFIFGSDFGEIVQADGHCCPYFRTLPEGQDYLAVGMETIQAMVDDQCGSYEREETVARLALELAWERNVHPFGHTHGQENHLEQVDSSCFPIQRLVKVPMLLKNKDKDVLKRKRGRPYSCKEADNMNTVPGDADTLPEDQLPKDGMVVFGDTPNRKRLRELAEANLEKFLSLGSSQW